MEIISLLHHIARWLLVLAEAATWVWLVAMAVALLGWTMWAAHRLCARVYEFIRSPVKPRRASGRVSSTSQSASALHDPVFQMLPRQ